MKDFIHSTLDNHTLKLAETLLLIEKSFGYTAPDHFHIDFAPLMAKNNWRDNHLLLHSQKDQVVAHIGVMRRSIYNLRSTSRHPVGFIGGVAVDESYRGQGLFSSLMQKVLQTYEEQMALFILWSDRHDLYRKLGFYLSGSLVETTPLHENFIQEVIVKNGFEKTLYKHLAPAEKEVLKNYYDQSAHHISLVKREDDHWDLLAEITSSDLFLKRNLKGMIECYFFMNKGKDLPHIIHEMGCSLEKRSFWIRQLAQARLWLPPCDAELLKEGTYSPKYLGLFRLGNPQLFKNLVQDYSQGKIDLLHINKEEVHFLFEGEEYQESLENFFHALFGPFNFPEFASFANRLSICGLDSI